MRVLIIFWVLLGILSAANAQQPGDTRPFPGQQPPRPGDTRPLPPPGMQPQGMQQSPNAIVLLHDFHITESGSFVVKTIKEMGTEEFKVLAIATCAYFGVDCSSQASGAKKAAEFLSENYFSKSGNHFITGRVTQHDSGSEEWRGIFDAIPGHEVCRAALDYERMSITGESTFNTVILNGNNQRGLAFYAVVPKNRRSRQWVNATLAIQYVPIGTAGIFRCAAHNTNTWSCKGQNCNPLTRM